MLYVLLILLIATVITAAILLSNKKRVKEYQKRIDAITHSAPDVEMALAEISSFFRFSHYITESERVALEVKYDALKKEVSSFIRSKELSDCPQRESFLRFNKAMSDTKGHKETNNEHFIKDQLRVSAQYFDTVLAYPLDQQQREAVLSLEDNVLVISSAGSGKTMTTVGKVRYLIDKQHIPAEKILLITFTRKAAQSLSERLGERNLKCRTFHKLALDIISEVTGEKPSITPQDFSVQVYHKLSQENPSFRSAIADYIIRSRYVFP